MYIKTATGKEIFVRNNDLIKVEGARESYPIVVNDKDECGPWATISEWNGGFGEQIYLKTTHKKFEIINR
jgi:hypothetical protein